MTTNTKISLTSKLRPAVILFTFILALTTTANCQAQSIVGKWNQLKIKTYYTAEGAKKNGSPESEVNMSTIGTAIYVFYSNQTYRLETTTGDSKVITLLGTWSLSGNQLEMKLLPQQEDPKYNPKQGTPAEKTSIAFHGNIMEWTSNNLDNNLISKIVLTFAKNS
jgi:hypothetical protein